MPSVFAVNLHDWANKWAIPFAAFRDLQLTLGLYTPPLPQVDEGVAPKSEAFVQSLVRLEAREKGVYLFRNNVGALTPKDSKRPVRFGLGNDSEKINDVIKSSDLVGWRPVVIEQRHVGYKIAQFTCREVKEPGWQYSGTGREGPQQAWLNLVNACGGDAAFATGKGTL